MNDQTSPTADGQGPGSSSSSPLRNPLEEPRSAPGMPGAPGGWPAAPAAPTAPAASDQADVSARAGAFSGGEGAGRRPPAAVVAGWLPDLLVAAILLVTGAVLGVFAGLAWYRFAPTVWLTLPASAVSQVTSGVDQSALLVEPEGKGIASVDGYFFVFTAIVGLLLGVFGFYLARRGFLSDRNEQGLRAGAGIGAWAGVLLGGLAASTTAAALGRWVSMPDPLTVLHTIAAGHNFHAPVALHAQGLYLAAPLLGLVLFLALTAAFTKPSLPQWRANLEQQRLYYQAATPPHVFGPGAGVRDQPPAQGLPPVQPQQPGQQHGQPGQPGQPEHNGHAGGVQDQRPDATPDANSSTPQTGNPLG